MQQAAQFLQRQVRVGKTLCAIFSRNILVSPEDGLKNNSCLATGRSTNLICYDVEVILSTTDTDVPHREMSCKANDSQEKSSFWAMCKRFEEQQLSSVSLPLVSLHVVA